MIKNEKRPDSTPGRLCLTGEKTDQGALYREVTMIYTTRHQRDCIRVIGFTSARTVITSTAGRVPITDIHQVGS